MSDKNKSYSLFKISSQSIVYIVILILLLIIKYFFKYTFIFNSVIEIYGIIITSSIFIIISNSRQIQKDNFFLIIGTILVFMTILNLLQYILSFEIQNIYSPFKNLLNFIFIVRLLLIIFFIFFTVFIIKFNNFFLNKNTLIFITAILLLITIVELVYNKFSNESLNTISHFTKFILYLILYKTLVKKVLKEPIVTLIRDMETKENEYKTILNNTNDLIILTKNNGEIFYINSTCKKILECEPEKLLNKNIKSIYKDSKDKISDLFKKDRGFEYEFNIKTSRKNKNILHSWLSMKANNEKIIINILKDITFIKQFEKDKNKFLKELSEKNKDIEQIIYIISLNQSRKYSASQCL